MCHSGLCSCMIWNVFIKFLIMKNWCCVIGQIKHCPECQRRKRKQRKQPLRPVPVVGVYHHLQCDITYMEETTKGNKYLVNFIDIFSKYAWCFPVKQRDADSVLSCLKRLVSVHGRFPILQTDNGGEFINEKLQEFCSANQIGKLNY